MTVLEFHRSDRDGRVLISPGLVPLVRSRLGALGIAVGVEDRRRFDGPAAPDPAALAKALAAPGEFSRMLAAVAREPMGQVEVRGTAGLVRAMAAVCRLFARAGVLVLAGSRPRARRLWIGLLAELRGGVQLARGAWHRQGRVVVAPYTCVTDAWAWHVVLLADPHQVAGTVAAEKFATALGGGPTRRYAFVPAGVRYGLRQSLAVQHAAGPVIHLAGPGARAPAAVRVAGLAAPSLPTRRRLEGLEHKRAAWRDEGRNHTVAAAARALASADLYRLWELGLLLDTPEDYFNRFARSPRVAVLVESVEQGEAVLRHLPGWRLLRGGVCPARPRTRRSLPPASGPAGEVVTIAYAARHRLHVDVLVRADGGAGLPPVKDFPPARDDTLSGGVLLVDAADDGDARGRSDAATRLRSYADAGWVVDATRRRPARSAATRPHVMPPDAVDADEDGDTTYTPPTPATPRTEAPPAPAPAADTRPGHTPSRATSPTRETTTLTTHTGKSRHARVDEPRGSPPAKGMTGKTRHPRSSPGAHTGPTPSPAKPAKRAEGQTWNGPTPRKAGPRGGTTM